MQRFPGSYGLASGLVGELSGDQVRELFGAGWRFDPDGQLWVKVFYAVSGEVETPSFLVDVIVGLRAIDAITDGEYPGEDPVGARSGPPDGVDLFEWRF